MPWTELGPANCRSDIDIATLVRIPALILPALILCERRYRRFLHRIDGGCDAGARVAAKIGTNQGYQWLLETACPGAVDRPHPGRINFKKTFDARTRRWCYTFEKEYWPRWDHARRSIGDNRWHGKVRCAPDITAEQAAKPGLELCVARWIDLRGRGPVLRHPCISGFYFPPFTVKGTMGETRFASFYHPVFLLVEYGWLPWHRLPPARRYVYSNIIWTGHPEGHRVAERVGLADVLSRQAMADSRARDSAKPKPARIARLDQAQELLCFELMGSLSSAFASQPQPFLADLLVYVRNKIIAAHIWLIKREARKHRGQAEFAEMVNEGVFGLCKALDGFDPEKGYRFQTFAWRQIERSIRDYLRKQRQLRRHQSTDAMADKGTEWVLGLYRSGNSVRRDEYKIISDAWGKS